MLAIPASSRWIFWDVDPDAIDLERDPNAPHAHVESKRRVSVSCALAGGGASLGW
jgi:hypothetical protein